MTTVLRVLAHATLAAGLMAAACSRPDAGRAKKTTIPTYDTKSGRLTQLASDRNGNGIVDTWSDMDGNRPLRSRIDLDEDGKIDRWEYYDASGALAKVGFSRKHDGRVDAWAFSAPDGTVARVEMSAAGDEHKIDRREFYERGALVRAEEDTNADGRVDRWETYDNGALRTATLDENADGVADRRLTYEDGALVLIESEPDAAGRFARRVAVK